jgi:hypothetical protein
MLTTHLSTCQLMSLASPVPSGASLIPNGTSPVVVSCVDLGPLRPQKAAAHRQIQEQLSHLDRRPRRVRGGPRLDRFPTEDANAGAESGAARAGRQGERGDGADGVEGLAPKTQSVNAGEVVGALDLADRVCRVALLRFCRYFVRLLRKSGVV